MLLDEGLYLLQHALTLRAKFCLLLSDRIELAFRASMFAQNNRALLSRERGACLSQPLPIRTGTLSSHVASH